MSHLPVVTGREAIRALERAGFYVDHQTGSHAGMIHRTRSAFASLSRRTPRTCHPERSVPSFVRQI